MIGVSKIGFVVIILTFFAWTTPAQAYCEWPCFNNQQETKVISKKTTSSKKITRQKNNQNNVPIVSGIISSIQKGIASFYWQPQPVACGGRFNPEAMTAAHKSLKCGSKVRVTNQRNGKSVVVTINDRGPYIKGRVIDLSKAAARQIDMISSGIVPVKVEVLG